MTENSKANTMVVVHDAGTTRCVEKGIARNSSLKLLPTPTTSPIAPIITILVRGEIETKRARPVQPMELMENWTQREPSEVYMSSVDHERFEYQMINRYDDPKISS